jgi:hypothetical protein
LWGLTQHATNKFSSQQLNDLLLCNSENSRSGTLRNSRAPAAPTFRGASKGRAGTGGAHHERGPLGEGRAGKQVIDFAANLGVLGAEREALQMDQTV